MSLENIKAVFFDADNTLIDHRECEKQALLAVFQGIGVTYKEEYQTIFRPLDRRLWDSVAQGTCPVSRKEIPEYRFKVLFEQLGIEYQDYSRVNELFKEGLTSSSALMEHAEEIVQYLYEKKYRLYVVTNGKVNLQRPRVMNSNIAKFITDIIVSEEVGADKPSPKMFQVLLKRVNLTSKEVIMVGDSLDKDVQGAHNAGIRAVWFNQDECINDSGIVPEYEIRSLLELENLL
ncbi:MAG: YjjG family noncanonical pyrimidine nucleotidase [Lachnospiraceae bacterium]|nr:YjjG family noncanonical pyrimidine nucleotidase [Lachnospiraceae bacterium]